MDFPKMMKHSPNERFAMMGNQMQFCFDQYGNKKIINNMVKLTKGNFEKLNRHENHKTDRTFDWLIEQDSLHSKGYDFNEVVVENVELIDDKFDKKNYPDLLETCFADKKLKNGPWKMNKVYNQIQWVYPEFLQKPTVRRNYAKRGVISMANNFSYDGNLATTRKNNGPNKREKPNPKSIQPIQVYKPNAMNVNDYVRQENAQERVPYRPVLIIKNNKLIKKFKPPVGGTLGSLPMDVSENVNQNTKPKKIPTVNMQSARQQGTPILDKSKMQRLKKEKQPDKKSNIFSVFNTLFSSKKNESPNSKYNPQNNRYSSDNRKRIRNVPGTDIISVLHEKKNRRKKTSDGHDPSPSSRKPLETPLKFANPPGTITTHEVAGIQVQRVKGRKATEKTIDRKALKQIKRLKEETRRLTDHLDNGIFTVESPRGKSSLKNRNRSGYEQKRKRKLSWHASVYDNNEPRKDQHQQTDVPSSFSQELNKLATQSSHQLQRSQSKTNIETINNMKEIFKAKVTMSSPSVNRVIDIGKLILGDPEEQEPKNTNNKQHAVFINDDNDEDEESVVKKRSRSRSIINISSHKFSKLREDNRKKEKVRVKKNENDKFIIKNETKKKIPNRHTENNDFDVSGSDIGTKIISDILSDILEKPIKNKRRSENKDTKDNMNQEKRQKKPKNKKLIKLEAERVDNKILIKRKIDTYKEGKKESADVLYYMNLDEGKESLKGTVSTISEIDPIEKEQEERLLYFLKKWVNGEINLIFAKKDDLNSIKLDKIQNDDTLIVVNDDNNKMIRVKSLIMDSGPNKNIDYNIKDPKWINIVNDIIKYRRGRLSESKKTNGITKAEKTLNH